MEQIYGVKARAINSITLACGVLSCGLTFESAFVNNSCHRIKTKRRVEKLFSSASLGTGDSVHPKQLATDVAIIGGGLAGLSVAYHLLDIKQTGSNEDNGLMNSPLQITIYDKSRVGEGGASAVAGG
jgi:NADH dehydrogenase FAD-containing subunit